MWQRSFARQVALVPDRHFDFYPPPPQSPSATSRKPPLFAPGSLYQSKLMVPVLGPQVFALRIMDETTAHIVIGGLLRLDDKIRYTVCDMTGKISFVLTEHTKRVLRRFGTRLGSVGYDSERDEARLEVHPPLPFSLTLQFERVFETMDKREG